MAIEVVGTGLFRHAYTRNCVAPVRREGYAVRLHHANVQADLNANDVAYQRTEEHADDRVRPMQHGDLLGCMSGHSPILYPIHDTREAYYERAKRASKDRYRLKTRGGTSDWCVIFTTPCTYKKL